MAISEATMLAAEAVGAAERATSDREFVQFSEPAAEGMLGLLEAAGGVDVAKRMLRPLDVLPVAEWEVLLNALPSGWSTTAPGIRPRQLRVHRHTLRHRVASVERLTGLDLSQFAGRAELWAALTRQMPQTLA